MATRKPVGADTVREWAVTPEGTAALNAAEARFPGKRGRLHPSTVEVFHAENPKSRYVVGTASQSVPTVTVVIPGTDKNGRNRPRKRVLPVSEVRALAGVEAQRGRLPQEALTKAGEALASQS
jgi:hypothetical protein